MNDNEADNNDDVCDEDAASHIVMLMQHNTFHRNDIFAGKTDRMVERCWPNVRLTLYKKVICPNMVIDGDPKQSYKWTNGRGLGVSQSPTTSNCNMPSHFILASL